MEPLPHTSQALTEMMAYGDTFAAKELFRLGRQIPQVVPECVGISLGLHTDRFTFTLVANNDMARVLDVAQYLDDGPCVTAMDAGDTVATDVQGLFDEERWLMFARTQAAHGIASSLSLPILRDGRVIAGVNLYGSTHDAFDGHHEELAAICRAWSPGTVSNADLAFATRLDAQATPARMHDQNDVNTAVGMLAEMHRINMHNARTRLQRSATQAGVSPTQAARVILRALAGNN